MLFLISLMGVSLLGTQDIGVPTLRDDQPIDVSAGRCEVFENQDTVRCEGSVRVSQGEAILAANLMTIYGTQAEGGFRRIEAEGDVRYATGDNAMSGKSAVYDAATTTLTVTGDVVVVQADQVMTGGRLIYNTTSGATVFMPSDGG
ncbi:MAG: LptA/OstA family protein, partial [Pseudomonadota bacterium]